MTRQYHTDQLRVLRADGRIDLLPVAEFGHEEFGSLTRLTLPTEPDGLPFEGFGASLTEAAAWNLARLEPGRRRRLLEELFGPDGTALDILRLNVGASDYSLSPYHYAPVADDRELEHFTIARDERWLIPILHEILAIRPDIFLFASPWSPPGWMKTGGQMAGGWMRADYLEVFAKYYARYLAAFRAHGIHIDALTCQNEVETDQLSRMPASLLHPEYEMRLVSELLPAACAAEGVEDVEIWLHDHNYIHWRRIDWMLADPATRAHTAAVAVHPYEGTAAMLDTIAAKYPGLPFHLTEVGPGLGPDYDNDVCRWGHLITEALNHYCVSFTAWNLALDECGRPNIGPFNCAGLVTIHSQERTVSRSSLLRVFDFLRPALPRGARRLAADFVQLQNGTRSGFAVKGRREPLALASRVGDRIHLIVTNSGARQDIQLELDGLLLRLEVPENTMAHLEIRVEA